jgi:hypothetical protein
MVLVKPGLQSECHIRDSYSPESRLHLVSSHPAGLTCDEPCKPDITFTKCRGTGEPAGELPAESGSSGAGVSVQDLRSVSTPEGTAFNSAGRPRLRAESAPAVELQYPIGPRRDDSGVFGAAPMCPRVWGSAGLPGSQVVRARR